MKKLVLQSISKTGDSFLRPASTRSFWKWTVILIALVAALLFGYQIKNIFAQTNHGNILYIPLIGITSVPDPLTLPKGPGQVTYHYAVKNFLEGVALTDVKVFDNKCTPVNLTAGDDNGDGKLDYSETWIYTCRTKVSTTTQSTATATGMANNILAAHSVYATVVVGSNTPPPLVSIINVTKVAYPLSLPSEGGSITFTYKVTNPGIAPLGNVTVTDDRCNAMSGHLGDTNGNNLLDANEVWIYTCTVILKKTTTNTVTVTGFANGSRAVDSYTITVEVAPSATGTIPGFPNTGLNPNPDVLMWEILGTVLVVLIILILLIRRARKQ